MLVDAKRRWGRSDIPVAEIALVRRQNKMFVEILDLLSAASREGTPFWWVQRSESLLFALPPIKLGLSWGCLSTRQADACQNGTSEKNLVSVLCPTGLVLSAALPLQRCTGGHVHSSPEDWERNLLARNTLPRGLHRTLFGSHLTHNVANKVRFPYR